MGFEKQMKSNILRIIVLIIVLVGCAAKTEYEQQISSAENNIKFSYEQKDRNKTLFFLYKALDLYEDVDNTKKVIYTLHRLSKIDKKNSEFLAQRALNLSRSYGDEELLLQSYFYKALSGYPMTKQFKYFLVVYNKTSDIRLKALSGIYLYKITREISYLTEVENFYKKDDEIKSYLFRELAQTDRSFMEKKRLLQHALMIDKALYKPVFIKKDLVLLYKLYQMKNIDKAMFYRKRYESITP